MRRALSMALAALMIGMVIGGPTQAAPLGRYEVRGVDDDDMLKLRAGPGTGYRVIVGLPNGTVLRVLDCQQSGNTNWCKVALDEARGLKGYVSFTYLNKL